MTKYSKTRLALCSIVASLTLSACDISLNTDDGGDKQDKFLQNNIGSYRSIVSDNNNLAHSYSLIVERNGALFISENDRDEQISHQAQIDADHNGLIFDDGTSCHVNTNDQGFSCTVLDAVISLKRLDEAEAVNRLQLAGSYQAIYHNKAINMHISDTGELTAQYQNCQITGKLREHSGKLIKLTDSCTSSDHLAYFVTEALSEQQSTIKVSTEHPVLAGYWL